jgi:hypothetical protein
MSTATITQAQDKGLRHQFAGITSDVLAFCRKLYGGKGPSRPRAEKKMSPTQLEELADRFEAYSPSLSVELRFLASRG